MYSGPKSYAKAWTFEAKAWTFEAKAWTFEAKAKAIGCEAKGHRNLAFYTLRTTSLYINTYRHTDNWV